MRRRTGEQWAGVYTGEQGVYIEEQNKNRQSSMKVLRVVREARRMGDSRDLQEVNRAAAGALVRSRLTGAGVCRRQV